MANLKKYDLSGKEIGEVAIDDKLLDGKPHRQMIKDYLVALKNNQRQWSANTKGRAEVKCTYKKTPPTEGNRPCSSRVNRCSSVPWWRSRFWTKAKTSIC